MSEVSTLRLYLLRLAYLIIVAGLGITIWPGIVRPPVGLPLMDSVVRSMLGGLSFMALFGLRYPLQLIPLLLFEIAWKVIWIFRFGLPVRMSGQMDPAWQDTWGACVMIVIILPLIPWRYVIERYILAPGERWKSTSSATG